MRVRHSLHCSGRREKGCRGEPKPAEEAEKRAKVELSFLGDFGLHFQLKGRFQTVLWGAPAIREKIKLFIILAIEIL